MVEKVSFDDWLRRLMDESDFPFVRDCEQMVQYFYELHSQLPLEYGWRVYSVEAFNNARNKIWQRSGEAKNEVAHEIISLYWHDMASNIEAFSVMMIWRSGEIIRHVIKSMNSRDVLTPAILSRSLLEIAAFGLKNSNIILKTMEEINASISLKANQDMLHFTEDLEKILLRMIYGTRLDEPPDYLEQTNALTYIQWVSKNPHANELLPVYSFLCELAHPNVMGNARFWSALEDRDENGSERVRMKQYAESITTTDIRQKTLWALSWSAGTIRNSFELLRQANLIILNRWPKRVVKN